LISGDSIVSRMPRQVAADGYPEHQPPLADLTCGKGDFRFSIFVVSH
jgi:hypothetical protein